MKLNIPNHNFDGYIFDFDGTLVNSMPLHFKAWTASFKKHEVPWVWSKKEFYESAGVPDKVTISNLNLRYNTNYNPDEIYSYKEKWYLNNLSQLDQIIPVVTLAEKYYKQGSKISIASGSSITTISQSIISSGIKNIFDIIITPKDVKKGKPSPDMFLLASEKMNVNPKKCLVFEDSLLGIEAANNANMYSVLIPKTF